MIKKIPLPYQIIIRKLLDRACIDGIIETGKARFILTYHCRIPKTLATSVIQEMERECWINFKNHKFIQVVANVGIVLDNRIGKF